MSLKRFQKKLRKIKIKGERQKARHELESKYAQYYPHKNGKKVSNIMLAIIVIAIVGYTAADFILQYYTGNEISSTLTTCWFSFWGAEIIALTGIKVSKVLKASSEESSDDEIIDDDSVG
jgi:H+/gluconate symporter-like permease